MPAHTPKERRKRQQKPNKGRKGILTGVNIVAWPEEETWRQEKEEGQARVV